MVMGCGSFSLLITKRACVENLIRTQHTKQRRRHRDHEARNLPVPVFRLWYSYTHTHMKFALAAQCRNTKICARLLALAANTRAKPAPLAPRSLGPKH